RAVERSRLRETLSDVQDLDRIVGRVSLGTCSPRDLRALARSLRALPEAAVCLEECVAPLVRAQSKGLDPPLDVAADIEAVVVDEPPPTAREGGVIRPGARRRSSRPCARAWPPRRAASRPPRARRPRWIRWPRWPRSPRGTTTSSRA